jgi:hypothetical protein
MKSKNLTDDEIDKNYNKFEDPLWKEDVPVSKTIRIQLENKTENIKDCVWNFFENNVFMCRLSASSLTQKQIKFLQSSNGFSFLLTKYKQGDISVRTIKMELKNVFGNERKK